MEEKHVQAELVVPLSGFQLRSFVLHSTTLAKDPFRKPTATAQRLAIVDSSLQLRGLCSNGIGKEGIKSTLAVRATLYSGTSAQHHQGDFLNQDSHLTENLFSLSTSAKHSTAQGIDHKQDRFHSSFTISLFNHGTSPSRGTRRSSE